MGVDIHKVGANVKAFCINDLTIKGDRGLFHLIVYDIGMVGKVNQNECFGLVTIETNDADWFIHVTNRTNDDRVVSTGIGSHAAVLYAETTKEDNFQNKLHFFMNYAIWDDRWSFLGGEERKLYIKT